MKDLHICFIGAGNMAQSLIGGMIADGLPSKQIAATDISKELLSQVAANYQIHTSTDNQSAVQNANIVVLAVKPIHIKDVLTTLSLPENCLVVSVAAGIRMIDLQKWTSKNQAIVRCMPNTPALVQSGATGLFANQKVTNSQRENAESILRAVGLTCWLDEEKQLDNITALSGSGPAYYFLMMEAMQKAAIKLGLDEKQAQLFSIQTAFGAAKMALESDIPPAKLRQNVTSKNGTTEAALNSFQANQFEEIVFKAMQKAQQRSHEIGLELSDNS